MMSMNTFLGADPHEHVPLTRGPVVSSNFDFAVAFKEICQCLKVSVGANWVKTGFAAFWKHSKQNA